jgi:prevent-host-death family protein
LSKIVNMHDAKTTLSRLVERARAGEEIIIGKAGEPLVKLVPVKRRTKPRVPGKWRGKVWIADDFDELPSDILDAFEGKSS